MRKSLNPAQFTTIASVSFVTLILLGTCSIVRAECLSSPSQVRAAHGVSAWTTWHVIKGRKCYMLGERRATPALAAEPVPAPRMKVAASSASAARGPNSGFDSRDGGQPDENETVWGKLARKLAESKKQAEPGPDALPTPDPKPAKPAMKHRKEMVQSVRQIASGSVPRHDTRPRAEPSPAGADYIQDFRNQLRSYAAAFPPLGYRNEKQQILLESIQVLTAKERLRMMLTDDAWMGGEALKEFEAWLNARAAGRPQ